MTRLWMTLSAQYPIIIIILEVTIQNPMMSLFSDHPESNVQAAIKWSPHVIACKTSHSNSIDSHVGATRTSLASGGEYCLIAGGWMPACAAGIPEGIQFSAWKIESASWRIYVLPEWFKQSQWAIGFMESWKSLAIWALCWRHDRPPGQCRTQRPDNPFRHSRDGHVRREAYSYQLWDVCQSLCHECGEDRPESYLAVWGNGQDWSSPAKLRPSMCLHFSGKCIISTIVFIAEVVRQALAKFICSHGGMESRRMTSIDFMYGSRTQSPTGILRMVAWLLDRDRFTCPTNVHEVSSKFPSCLTVALAINSGVQVSICSDWNCGSYSPDILLWHTTYGNER